MQTNVVDNALATYLAVFESWPNINTSPKSHVSITGLYTLYKDLR